MGSDIKLGGGCRVSPLPKVGDFITDLLVKAQNLCEDSGQTLVEYGLIAMLLSIAAVVVLGAVGQDMVTLFTKASTALQNSTP
jgi:Flp pilus assembly pilin Flp